MGYAMNPTGRNGKSLLGNLIFTVGLRPPGDGKIIFIYSTVNRRGRVTRLQADRR